MTTFQIFLNSKKIYKPEEIEKVFELIQPDITRNRAGKNYYYIDMPCAFDLETSSFYTESGDKRAIMYAWTFGIDGIVIFGRTWDQFEKMTNKLSELLELNTTNRLPVYVHNLAFDFQFFRKYFHFENVFSIKSRTPIYGTTSDGYEFKCSYILTGRSLENLGEQLQKYKVKKLTGFLDYDKIRHTKTPLTEKEIEYCVNDVKVIMAYIQEQKEQYGHISKLPLTKTGYVRRYCRQKAQETGTEDIKGLKLSLDEYNQLKRAFQGGFTHSNPMRANETQEGVTSYDFTSSYPAVMVSEKFPMGKSEKITIRTNEEFLYNIKNYCCIFDIEFFDIEASVCYENYISESRCWNKRKIQAANGRIVSADHIETTITEQDYLIISQFYKWKKCRIRNFRRYPKGYLPESFIRSILTLYSDKTKLKGVKGQEFEYLLKKEMLNSCYGMTVTDIIRDDIIYDNATGWREEEKDKKTELNKYNYDYNRFLFYPWGVWITAYARRNLFYGIKEAGIDYVYSDTDSIKIINAEKHEKFIHDYNIWITKKLKRTCDFFNIEYDFIEPETIKGENKPLGVWDFDGNYSKFKTLGAKRYLVEYSDDKRNGGDAGKISLTVSGLNKKVVIPYMLDKYGPEKIFDIFTDELEIPPEYTGKKTHTYIDEEMSGTITDYTGETAEYTEKSGIHLENAPFKLSMHDFLEYIEELKGDIKR